MRNALCTRHKTQATCEFVIYTSQKSFHYVTVHGRETKVANFKV